MNCNSLEPIKFNNRADQNMYIDRITTLKFCFNIIIQDVCRFSNIKLIVHNIYSEISF